MCCKKGNFTIITQHSSGVNPINQRSSLTNPHTRTKEKPHLSTAPQGGQTLHHEVMHRLDDTRRAAPPTGHFHTARVWGGGGTHSILYTYGQAYAYA